MDGDPASHDDVRSRARGGGRARSAWGRVAWRLALCLAVAYLAVVLLMMFIEESLIFFPSPYPAGDWEPTGIAYEDAWFEAADGTRLHGWYAPHDDPRATILFAHGNAGNVTHRADVLRVLHDRVRASVLIFDYRGYGRSQGKPNEKGVLMDARAARAWLAEREGIAETDVVLMGRSLGGTVVVDLAAKQGARGLVLENSFTSVPDVAAYYYPWLPVRWVMRTRLNAKAKIGDYHGPLLISHGEADTIIPITLGRRLFEAANEPKQWIAFPDRDHNDPHPAWYYDKLIEFLDGLR